MVIDTEKFTKDFDRMCNGNNYMCSECLLYGTDCNLLENIDKIAPIVIKWAEEHPAKTYLDDIKEKFPNFKMHEDFYHNHCVATFYGNECRYSCLSFSECEKCWNREME